MDYYINKLVEWIFGVAVIAVLLHAFGPLMWKAVVRTVSSILV